MRKYVKGIIVLFILLFVISFVAKPVFAESSGLNVTMKEGLDGKIKSGKGFPLQITVENTGQSFSGDLLIDYYPSYNTGGTMAVQIELPEKSSKTYVLSIPGMTEDHPSQYQNLPAIHLYRGDWKEGKEVSFKGNKVLKPKYIEIDKQIMGVLSENIDRLKELKSIASMNSNPIEMIQMQSEQMPKQALGLEMIDYLLVDEFAIAKLDENQQLAIKTWINNGGVLIAGGSPDTSQSFGMLYELLPMKINAETQVNTAFFKDGKREDPAFNKLAVFTGSVGEEAVVVAESDGTPVITKQEYGTGLVIQTGFSLGDEPLSSWNGYADWFNELLLTADKPSFSANPYGQDLYSSLYYEFAEINEYFPASQFSILQLTGLLAGYLIILVPVLYFVLKRLDKREHAWWIIPAISILMSAVVFGIGAKDRISQPQLNQMGIYASENGYLSGYQAATLLSNKSGTYSLEIPKDQFKAMPSTDAMSPMPSAEGVFEEKRQGYEVVFQNVEYWSSRTLFGDAKKESDGSFQSDLIVNNNVLSGTIQNNFPYDFRDISIWTGKDKLSLGPLKKGKVMKVNEKVKQSILSAPFGTNFQGYPMPNQKVDIEEMKKERLEYSAGAFLLGNINSGNLPIIAGITDDEIITIDMADEKEKKNNSNLIVEPFKAEGNITGKFTLSQEGLVSSFNIISGRIYEKVFSANEMMLEDGQYEYILQLPDSVAAKPVLLEEIKVRTNGSPVSFELYNYQKAEYVPIEQTTFKLTANEHVEEFLSKDGKIMLRLNKHSNGDPYVIMPDITIKGEVLP